MVGYGLPVQSPLSSPLDLPQITLQSDGYIFASHFLANQKYETPGRRALLGAAQRSPCARHGWSLKRGRFLMSSDG